MKKAIAFLLTLLLAAGTVLIVHTPPIAAHGDDEWKTDAVPLGRPAKDPIRGRLSGLTIGLDPGHQKKANNGKEPVAPGSSVKKKKVSSGTQGRFTRVPEYVVNLQAALKLKTLLENEGARVVMTRTTHDVNISNAERAQLFNREGVDLAIRLHCNGTKKTGVYGAFILIPSQTVHAAACMHAARCILDAYIKATGTKNRGITKRSDQSGFNWCTRPIINIEMGYMTNKAEDRKLASSGYQNKMAKGLFNGICLYFGR